MSLSLKVFRQGHQDDISIFFAYYIAHMIYMIQKVIINMQYVTPYKVNYL